MTGWRRKARGAVDVVGLEACDTLLEIAEVVDASLSRE
jgi:hypothetical protein